MPPKYPKKPTGRDTGSESDTDAEQNRTMVPTSSSSKNITMSEEMLQSLVSTITKNQAEANRILIESILANKDAPCTSSPRIPDARENVRRSGNFAKCTARFDGVSKNAEELEAFIDAIEIYRDCTNISDEHALRGLPMLLVGEAAIWWQGVKASVRSWSDALLRLRGMYGVPRPGYKLFRDIFRTEQDSCERADVFICKVRALVSKLPYVVPEVMLLDIVYGLLHRRIRKRVSRDEVDDLEQLLAKARFVEESLAEVSAHILIPDNNVNNTKSESVIKDSNSDGEKRVRPKCTYCRSFGHTVENCRNKAKEPKVIDPSDKSNESSELRCYGCGQLGVVRSKCSKCKDASTSVKSDFCSAQVVNSDDPQSLVEIQVVNRKGIAILDTGATHSIAGPMLYNLLLKAGVVFKENSRTIGLADGSQQVGTVLECTTDIILRGRVIPIMFIVLPDAQPRTLLGRDFIMKAGIIIDLPQSSWRFNNEPECWHPFITGFKLSTGGQMELMKVEASNLVLKDDEGTKTTAAQRIQLNAFLLKRSDRFERGGPPTEYARHRLKIDPRQEPSSSPTYRMSLSKRALLEQGVQKLQDPDVRKITEDLKSTDDPFRGSRGRRRFDRGYKNGRYRNKDHRDHQVITTCMERVSSGGTLGRYHIPQLTPFIGDVAAVPVKEKRMRGRPRRYLD